MTAEPVLKIEHLLVSYGRIEAVRGISLSMQRGRIVTIIGANGAGKSSTLNAIMGITGSKGRVFLDGVDLSSASMEERVAHELSLVPERRELFATMSVDDNLTLGGYRLASHAAINEAKQAIFERFPRLKERRAQLAGTLSGGERQMLAMARALMARPKVLMLDEPSLGLAPIIVRDLFEIIKGLRDDGVSILLVEQNARAAVQIADYGYVMELGEIRKEGPAGELMHDPSIAAAYLGGPVH